MLYKKFLPYNDAILFTRKLNLKGQNDWRKYCSSGNRPLNIPSHPSVTYKNKGWINWMEWLGTNNHTGRSRIYNVNDNYFKKWSHDMAYILGFWFADGFIYKNKFFLTQHKKDRILLEQILKKMKSNYPLNHDKRGDCLFIEMSSKVLVNDILNLGGSYKKSKTCSFPHIPDNFLNDFIRGNFDGDGWISHMSGKREKSKKYFTSGFSSGSLKFIKCLQKQLQSHISDFGGNIYKQITKAGTNINGHISKEESIVYVLSIGINDTKRLKEFMYKNHNCLKMNRKYKQFMKTSKIQIAKQDKEFWSFKDAKKYVNKLNIKNCYLWKTYAKTQRPEKIPSNPDTYYKNKGWNGWKKWLNN